MSFSITKQGKRDEVADDIENGDHHAPGDQSQLDAVRGFVAGEIRAAATADHDVHVTITGHHKDEGIDSARQYRSLSLSITASPDPTRTAGALGLDNRQLNVPGLTTETIRAAETIRTDTPHLADGPDPGTKVVGGPRMEVGPETAVSTAPPSALPGEKVVETPVTTPLTAQGLVDLATQEQAQGQVATQNMITTENLVNNGDGAEEKKPEEDPAQNNTEVKSDGTEESPADEEHTAGETHLVGESETVTPEASVKESGDKEEDAPEGDA